MSSPAILTAIAASTFWVGLVWLPVVSPAAERGDAALIADACRPTAVAATPWLMLRSWRGQTAQAVERELREAEMRALHDAKARAEHELRLRADAERERRRLAREQLMVADHTWDGRL